MIWLARGPFPGEAAPGFADFNLWFADFPMR
jgi:hypothetical protein